ncbi:hypothetical protein N0X72_07095 [Streptomyces carpaticus]|uniref:Uncharacterized protein n=2 Tax=Streptomyces TaxID=1883 RepID=A0A1I6RRG7_9ACTN|nr:MULTISPECIES: hypothetical protein [Streptomyces]QKV68490.1 hypothetical protein HUT13_06600 [Streptomyces harbinensis]UWM48809.1 hypothetical protein N0X72_07095 [Streptomyces carpaticus]SFS67307.1 hypothetical protein SAMN05444716_103314 [Streptomyces harbinensis]
MASDDDYMRRTVILEEEVPNAESYISQYKIGIDHQQRRLRNLNYELGRLNERIGDVDHDT